MEIKTNKHFYYNKVKKKKYPPFYSLVGLKNLKKEKIKEHYEHLKKRMV